MRKKTIFFKNAAGALVSLAATAIVIICCENNNRPEPLVCNHTYDSLVFMVKTDQGQAPIGPAISLNTLEKMIITDTSVQAIVNIPENQTTLSIDSVAVNSMGKIIFK